MFKAKFKILWLPYDPRGPGHVLCTVSPPLEPTIALRQRLIKVKEIISVLVSGQSDSGVRA